jgi:uncharacterized protein YbjT (DUF2867 family)
MRTAFIAGATGLVGSNLLNQLVDSKKYNKIKILVRKPIELNLPNVEQVLYDYNNPDTALLHGDDIYCCLGTTIKKAGSQKAFKDVDYEYPLQIAKAGFVNGAKTFAIVTAIGANPDSRFFYNRVKGEIERELRKIPFKRILIFRPSMLLGPRNEFRFGEELGKGFMKVFNFIFPKKYKAVHASQVAASMIDFVNRAGEGITIIESDQMQGFPVLKNSKPLFW